jgi:hypothetical protein
VISDEFYSEKRERKANKYMLKFYGTYFFIPLSFLGALVPISPVGRYEL